ncbi:MAG: hypothetical protein ACRC33_12800 [Gemmataceae bacterium]
MKNTNEIEMREILGVYEQGAAMGTGRGLKAGVVIGALCALFVAGVVLVALCASGGLRFGPPGKPTGPIGEPPAGVVPGLPPAGGPAAPLGGGPVPTGTTVAPPVKAGPASSDRPAPQDSRTGPRLPSDADPGAGND